MTTAEKLDLMLREAARLTPWQRGMVASAKRAVDRGDPIPEGWRKHLTKIWRKVGGGVR